MVFSFFRRAIDAHVAGSKAMEAAWDAYEAQLQAEGVDVSCFSRPPGSGARFWVYLSTSGRVCFDDASILRKRVTAVNLGKPNGLVGPVDERGRPLPHETQTVEFSGTSGSYYGLAAPSDLEHLLRGHPYEKQLRELRAGKRASVQSNFDGVPTKRVPVYAVPQGTDRWQLRVDRPNGQGELCGYLTYPRGVQVRETHVIWGPNNWPAAKISALILAAGTDIIDAMAKGHATFEPTPSWSALMQGGDAVLVQRFRHEYDFDPDAASSAHSDDSNVESLDRTQKPKPPIAHAPAIYVGPPEARNRQSENDQTISTAGGKESQLATSDGVTALQRILSTLPTTSGYVVLTGQAHIRFVIVHGENLQAAFDGFTTWASATGATNAEWLSFSSHGFYEPCVAKIEAATEFADAADMARDEAARRSRIKPGSVWAWPECRVHLAH